MRPGGARLPGHRRRVFCALAQAGVAFDPQCGMLLDSYLNNRPTWEGLPGFGAREYAVSARLQRARTLPEMVSGPRWPCPD